MSAEIHGGAEDGFGPVADAFAANFRDAGERGAVVAPLRVRQEGRPLGWRRGSTGSTVGAGANGMGTAEGLARLYAACVSEVDGRRIMTPAQIDDALVARSFGQQLFGPPDRGERWGTGFALDSPAQPLLGSRSFGHAGAGGELAFGDDTQQVGFGYVNNQMGGIGDARAARLTTAVRACLRG